MVNSIQEHKQDMDRNLATSLEAASSIITKNYLDKLEQYMIVQPSEEDIDIDVAECGHFYQISKLVFNKDERFLDKLTTIVNVAYSIGGTIASIIKSDGNSVEYYLGIISKNNRGMNELSIRRRKAASTAFHGAIQGNLIGSGIKALQKEDINDLKQSIFSDPERAVSSVSGIVALRNGDEKDISVYVQGIENLVDSLRGQKYSIVLVADPISSSELQVIRQGYELLYTQLSAYWRSTLTLNESDSLSLSRAQSEGVTTGITKGIALTQSKTNSRSKFISVSAGVNASVGFMGTGVGAYSGVSGGGSSSTADTNGETKSQSELEQRNSSYSRTTGMARSEGKSLQLQYENRSVKALLDKIEKQLARLEICESFGAFDCAAYVVADDRDAVLTVSSNYNALMRGEDSSIQASFINTWHRRSDVETLLTYLNSFVHPRFCEKASMKAEDKLLVTPASIINGNEMAIQIGLPKKSVTGISVIPMAPFGRNVREVEEERALHLGDLYHMGQTDAAKVTLDIQSLSAHTFITGSTGSGKSSTIYQLLTKLGEKGVTFLVVEPAKGEYKHVFGQRSDVNVFGTNAAIAPLLRLNPFVFPEGIHVLEHIDRLIEIFNVCWPMYAAMPAVLKEAIEEAYRSCGWDLVHSTNEISSGLFPTFVDVMESLQNVINQSAYSDELKSNYKGSLLTRVKSLTNGLNGQILCNGELDAQLLFDQNTIVDLSRVGSAETKSLIMGILIMRLQEHRMAQGGMNLPLRHITVLEEAHHLLKRTSSEQSMEGANLQGKSVEMLANAIAEMRTFGEGFVIADQAPGLLDASVIRNTNTKILLQTPDMNDRLLAGRAANLNDEQIVELAKLATGVAAVYQNNWLEPVLCKIEPFQAKHERYVHLPVRARGKGDGAPLLQEMLKLLLHGRLKGQLDVDLDHLEDGVNSADLSTRNKLKLFPLIEEYKKTKRLAIWDEQNLSDLSTLVTDLLNCRDRLEPIRAAAREPQELTEHLHHVISRTVGAMPEPMELTICQCILMDKSEESDEWLKLFYTWDHHIRKSIQG